MSCSLTYSLIRDESTNTAYLVLAITNLTLAILTVFANILILLSLRKCHSLHAPSKALFCSLAFSDLGVGLVGHPLFATYCFAVFFDNNEVFCAIRSIYAITAYCLGSVSFMTMAVISLDRYLAFSLRLRYHQIVTFKRVVLLIAACWIFGIIWPLSWIISETICKTASAFVAISGVIITSLSYIKINYGLRRHRRHIQSQQSALQLQSANNFSMGQYRKSLNTMVLIFCLLLVCSFPYATTIPVILVVGFNHLTLLAWNITGIFTFLNAFLNPGIYCWRIREIRWEVIVILRSLNPCCAIVEDPNVP